MVAKMTIGKTIRGVISYNENKVKEGTAVCLKAEGFPLKADGLSFHDKLRTFLDYHILKPKVKTNTVHISLNFDKTDKLDQAKIEEITDAYLNKIGFGGQPFLVYQHFDAAHPHVHIVTTNIRLDATSIDLHNIGRNQSEQARKEIEIEFNLTKAQGRRRNDEMMKPADVSKAIYGKSETKRAITNIVNAVTRSYRFTSIHEFNAVLKQYNVVADIGREGTLMRAKNGLHYSLIDKNGNAIGVPIKASSLYGKPTLKSLSGQFELNEIMRRPHMQRVKDIINNFNATNKNLDDFIRYMVSNRVYPVIRQNNEGRIYGITLIDNATKCVFNGSALGKQYSAQGILNRFDKPSEQKELKTPSLPVKEEFRDVGSDGVEGQEVNSSEILKELTEAKVDHSNTPYELKRRRKKKGRSI